MINNRMLAVAAVLVMAVPALGAATPIVVPPIPEQLVEGHTVFTVIEIVERVTTTESRFAAAVAVLVRERFQEVRNQRFPGVLWFNDQYLVNPFQANNEIAFFRYPCGGAVVAVNRGDPDPRVAIMRVTADQPGVNVIEPTGTNPSVPGSPLFGELQNELPHTSTDWTYGFNSHEPDPGTYGYANDYAWIGADLDDSNTVDVNADPAAGGPSVTATGNGVWTDTTVGSVVPGRIGAQGLTTINSTLRVPWDYRESYLITDPNDHSWVIDKYNFYTREKVNPNTFPPGVESDNLDNQPQHFAPVGDFNGDGRPESEHWPTDTFGGTLSTLYEYPVWVVNMLGSPVFIPDGGDPDLDNCSAFKDLLEEVSAPANGALCGTAADEANARLGTGEDDDITLNAFNGLPPWTDDPCMGYMEPSRNGYCYGGQAAGDVEGAPGGGPDGDVDKDDCLAERGNKPLRLYNALLYFKLQDLRVFGTPRDHSNPADPTDTNGCADEPHAWDTNPPHGSQGPVPPEPNPNQNTDDYDCPVGDDGIEGTADDDDAEGNSHPFHPSAPAHEERELCNPAFAGPNPTNHGGSTYIAPGTRATDAGWFQQWTPCDYEHATRNIDIYFSGAGRPFPPLVRYFDVVDLEGSSAPFQDYHSAYPASSP